jgi:hypothetical protein
VLARWGIRLGTSLVGIAAGLVLSWVVLSGVHMSVTALVEATLVFWVVHIVVSFMALRVLIRQPSVALAGLLAIASTVVSLIIVSLIVPGLSLHGMTTYVYATLLIWLTTALGDMVGRRMLRDRRERRRD